MAQAHSHSARNSSFHALYLRTSTVSKTFSKLFLFYLKADSLQIISSFFGASFHTLKAPRRALRNKSDLKRSAPLLILQVHVLQADPFHVHTAACSQTLAEK